MPRASQRVLYVEDDTRVMTHYMQSQGVRLCGAGTAESWEVWTRLGLEWYIEAMPSNS
jgi:hypothetical protein